MYVKSLQIENFRRFEKFECAFDPKLTLLMGLNGAGKSSLLKAIALPISAAMHRSGWSSPLAFERDDVRCGYSDEPSNESWKHLIFPSTLTVELETDEGDALLRLEHSGVESHLFQGRTAVEREFGPHNFQGQVLRSFSPENVSPIPLVARFGISTPKSSVVMAVANRPFEEKRQIWDRFNSDSIDASSLSQWFQFNEFRSLQEGREPLIYRAAKEAVIAATHAVDIKFVVRENRLMLRFAADGWRPFDELSDGQRRLAGLFMEIAVRASSLNSHLGDRCVAETPGLVLIDELDMHLHPQWQRAVIDDLLETFPKLQFIVASHSPFLIQSALERGIVVDVATGELATATDHSIEDITEQVMGVDQPQRSQRFLEMRQLAQEYLELMESPAPTAEAKADLKARLDQALSVFADDPAAAAWLSQRRIAKGI